MSIAERLLTVEEYQLLDDGDDCPSELVRGKIVRLKFADLRHGFICANVGRMLGCYLDQNDIGRAMTNDTGVITERNPDTVRGADVAYYSYDRLARGPVPDVYCDAVPELIFEVLSFVDPRPRVLAKVAEYLIAGVLMVCVLDPDVQIAHVFSAEEPDYIVTADQDLEFPGLLPGFHVQVGRFFG